MLKIANIEFKNHEFFGDQKISFTLPSGEIANTIILAGENGSGKTKLINAINSLSSTTFIISMIDQPIAPNFNTLVTLLDDSGTKVNEANSSPIEKIILSIDRGRERAYFYDSLGNKANRILDANTHLQIHSYKIAVACSDVNINYKPQRNVTGITNRTLDEDPALKQSDDLARDTIQLLVDIAAQDSQDDTLWLDTHPGETMPENERHRRIRRFTNAFSAIFGRALTFKSMRSNTVPIFQKNNVDIKVQDLSSGEKQIVFRGVQLLRNKKYLCNAITLVDEPEISMHPKWEKEILSYYRNICSNQDRQNSQLILATHSEHVISEALNSEDSLIIKIQAEEPTLSYFSKSGCGQILPTTTIAELKYSIFGLYTTDFHIALYGYLQNSTENTTVKGADEWLKVNGAELRDSSFTDNKGRTTNYETLPTLIRNRIDHPDSEYTYTDEEFERSTDFLIEKVKQVRGITA